ncbi:hypothetical protein DM831_19470, partial [Escherichia coli]|nr:hypothetical protein [Escherichia coli]
LSFSKSVELHDKVIGII